MIAHNSKSYPYLAIAQHYDVKYSTVLHYADWLKQHFNQPQSTIAWKAEVWKLERAKDNA